MCLSGVLGFYIFVIFNFIYFIYFKNCNISLSTKILSSWTLFPLKLMEYVSKFQGVLILIYNTT